MEYIITSANGLVIPVDKEITEEITLRATTKGGKFAEKKMKITVLALIETADYWKRAEPKAVCVISATRLQDGKLTHALSEVVLPRGDKDSQVRLYD